MTQTSWIEINLTKLDANVAALRQAVAGGPKPVAICAVVKADAYGLGATLIAQRLAARAIDMLAVYSQQQATDLLRVSLNVPILVLGPLRELSRTDPLYRTAVTGRLHLTIHDSRQIDQLNKIGMTFGRKLPAHLLLDTGMSRSGLSAAELPAALKQIASMRNLRLAGLCTHLASADNNFEQARTQVARLDKAVADNAGLWPADMIVHVANTFATMRDRAFHRDMIRPGLGLYGYGPELLEGAPTAAALPQLQPIFRWRSKINHVQRYPKGSLVGYNGTHRLERDSVLGVVPAGYADGYPLSLSGKGIVCLSEPPAGARPGAAVVRGRVNMDQVVIDLTDLPWAQVGAPVDLISDDPASPCALPALAKLAGSNCYEMLTRLSPRLVRQAIYLQEPVPV